ncbi:slipin family protein [Nonomuraea sp. NPDC049709]|uniref:slipin family protein n=1 Tax=Nonomuraea sp. NPDC049709 TaxID=3154736 RepID=UPI00341E50CB
MNPTLIGIGLAVLVLLILLAGAVKIVQEYERGVIFRLGRIQGAKGPGLFFIIPIVDRMVRVDLRILTADVPPQEIITSDNVTVRVDAVTYFQVLDPVKSVIAIEDYQVATSKIAQTTLRSILGQRSLDDLLMNRDEINQELARVIDDLTNPWGVKVSLVEVRDVSLPEPMRRAMARQAEAERDRRARVIHSLGEKEAARNLGDAAGILEEHPAAMQLRTLGSLVDAASQQGATVIFPVPVELVQMFRPHPAAGTGAAPTAPDGREQPLTAPDGREQPLTASDGREQPLTAAPDAPESDAAP